MYIEENCIISSDKLLCKIKVTGSNCIIYRNCYHSRDVIALSKHGRSNSRGQRCEVWAQQNKQLRMSAPLHTAQVSCLITGDVLAVMYVQSSSEGKEFKQFNNILQHCKEEGKGLALTNWSIFMSTSRNGKQHFSEFHEQGCRSSTISQFMPF